MVLTIQWNDLRDYEHGQEQLQRLHSLRDRIFVLSPRLRATLEIVETLERLEGTNILVEAESRSESAHYRRQFLYELKTYETLTKGFLESARSLEHRMEGILTMVRLCPSNTKSSIYLSLATNLSSTAQLSAALNLRDQATGVDISRGVLKLTTEIVSDSTTVRVITFVTLVFMPATFIAVSRAPFSPLSVRSVVLTFLDGARYQSIHLFSIGVGCGLPSFAQILDIRRSGRSTHASNHRMLVLLQSAYGGIEAQEGGELETQQAVQE